MIICFFCLSSSSAKKHKLQMQKGRGFESHGAHQKIKLKKVYLVLTYKSFSSQFLGEKLK
jgi:hypothetical protein